jgi:hypothetical protein
VVASRAPVALPQLKLEEEEEEEEEEDFSINKTTRNKFHP